MKYAIKARLSLLPTNITTHIWNRTNDPTCPFCRRHTESIAILFNGCYELRNFYNSRYDRIASKIVGEISTSNARLRTYTNRVFESILPELRDELVEIPARKPGIVIVNIVTREIVIVEVTVCFDLYMQLAYKS